MGSFCIGFHIEIHPFSVDAGFWRSVEVREDSVDNITLLTTTKTNSHLNFKQHRDIDLTFTGRYVPGTVLCAGDMKITETGTTLPKECQSLFPD